MKGFFSGTRYTTPNNGLEKRFNFIKPNPFLLKISQKSSLYTVKNNFLYKKAKNHAPMRYSDQKCSALLFALIFLLRLKGAMLTVFKSDVRWEGAVSFY